MNVESEADAAPLEELVAAAVGIVVDPLLEGVAVGRAVKGGALAARAVGGDGHALDVVELVLARVVPHVDVLRRAGAVGVLVRLDAEG